MTEPSTSRGAVPADSAALRGRRRLLVGAGLAAAAVAAGGGLLFLGGADDDGIALSAPVVTSHRVATAAPTATASPAPAAALTGSVRNPYAALVREATATAAAATGLSGTAVTTTTTATTATTATAPATTTAPAAPVIAAPGTGEPVTAGPVTAAPATTAPATTRAPATASLRLVRLSVTAEGDDLAVWSLTGSGTAATTVTTVPGQRFGSSGELLLVKASRAAGAAVVQPRGGAAVTVRTGQTVRVP